MRSRCVSVVVALVAVCSVPALAQVVPTGGELPSVADLTGKQHTPAVGLFPGGGLVAWDDELLGVMGRAVDTAGNPHGDSFVLAGNDAAPSSLPFHATLHEAHEPAIAARADGSFLATWSDQMVWYSVAVLYEQRYVISSRIAARLFHPDGTPASPIVILSPSANIAGLSSAVAVTNGFLVSWQERGGQAPGIHLMRLDGHGGVGADTLIASRGLRPAIAAGGNRTLVTWERCCGSGGGTQVYGRAFDTLGNAATAAFLVAADQPTAAHAAAVSGQPTGDFLVAYQRTLASNPRATDVYGQLVNKEGNLVGGELPLSSGWGDAHNAPAVAALASGGWVVCWVTWSQNFRLAVSAAAFSHLGNQTGAPFDLSDEGPVTGFRAALATSADGRVLAVWEGFDSHGDRGIRERAAQGPTR